MGSVGARSTSTVLGNATGASARGTQKCTGGFPLAGPTAHLAHLVLLVLGFAWVPRSAAGDRTQMDWPLLIPFVCTKILGLQSTARRLISRFTLPHSSSCARSTQPSTSGAFTPVRPAGLQLVLLTLLNLPASYQLEHYDNVAIARNLSRRHDTRSIPAHNFVVGLSSPAP